MRTAGLLHFVGQRMGGLSHRIRNGELHRLLLSFSMLLLCSIAVLLMLTVEQKSSMSVTISSFSRFLSWVQSDKSAPDPGATALPQQLEVSSLAQIRNGSVRCQDVQSLFPGRIPPIIHWTNRDQKVLQQHHSMLRSWRNVLGDTVAYMYWEDKDIEKLLDKHYRSLIPMYRKLRVGIMRSDIARLVILHHVGGVYSDLDFILLRNISSFLVEHSAVWSQEPIEHIYYMYRRMRLLSNALFMSQARHEFLDYVLNSWPNWFLTKWSNKMKSIWDPSRAIFITGPLMLNRFLDACLNDNSSQVNCSSVHLARPDQFQPVWDSEYAQRVSRHQCTKGRKTMTPAQVRHCDLLTARKFNQPPIDWNVTYGVHRFLHTSYGGRNSYANAKLARDILPLSYCII